MKRRTSLSQKRAEKMRKIDNSGEHCDSMSMDSSMVCGRTRHEAATMEQTIREIMRNTSSEGTFFKTALSKTFLWRFDDDEWRHAEQHDQMLGLSRNLQRDWSPKSVHNWMLPPGKLHAFFSIYTDFLGLHSLHYDADPRSRLWRSESQREKRT